MKLPLPWGFPCSLIAPVYVPWTPLIEYWIEQLLLSILLLQSIALEAKVAADIILRSISWRCIKLQGFTSPMADEKSGGLFFTNIQYYKSIKVYTYCIFYVLLLPLLSSQNRTFIFRMPNFGCYSTSRWSRHIVIPRHQCLRRLRVEGRPGPTLLAPASTKGQLCRYSW